MDSSNKQLDDLNIDEDFKKRIIQIINRPKRDKPCPKYVLTPIAKKFICEDNHQNDEKFMTNFCKEIFFEFDDPHLLDPCFVEPKISKEDLLEIPRPLYNNEIFEKWLQFPRAEWPENLKNILNNYLYDYLWIKYGRYHLLDEIWGVLTLMRLLVPQLEYSLNLLDKVIRLLPSEREKTFQETNPIEQERKIRRISDFCEECIRNCDGSFYELIIKKHYNIILETLDRIKSQSLLNPTGKVKKKYRSHQEKNINLTLEAAFINSNDYLKIRKILIDKGLLSETNTWICPSTDKKRYLAAIIQELHLKGYLKKLYNYSEFCSIINNSIKGVLMSKPTYSGARTHYHDKEFDFIPKLT